MKHILILIISIVYQPVLAQQVQLKGFVSDSTNGKSRINIQIEGKEFKFEAANSDGTFEITAFPSDSIKFSSHRNKKDFFHKCY